MVHQAGTFFLRALGGVLVHCRVTSSILFPSTHLYTWLESGTVRGKCLAQEQNTISQVRAQAQTAQPGHDCTNHEDISLATSLFNTFL